MLFFSSTVRGNGKQNLSSPLKPNVSKLWERLCHFPPSQTRTCREGSCEGKSETLLVHNQQSLCLPQLSTRRATTLETAKCRKIWESVQTAHLAEAEKGGGSPQISHPTHISSLPKAALPVTFLTAPYSSSQCCSLGVLPQHRTTARLGGNSPHSPPRPTSALGWLPPTSSGSP